MHLRILPDYQNQVLKKLFFNIWSSLILLILINRIKILKKVFFSVWSG